LPTLVINAGERTQFRFLEFFTVTIRNPNTRAAYFRAVQQLCRWCERKCLALEQVNPVQVAIYIEELGRVVSIPTVKQHLSAISILFDFLVTGHVMESNPAQSVKAPRYQINQGKTPILSAEEARQLLNRIDTTKIAGLRDRALIALMIYSFARVGVVLAMNVDDYFLKGKRWWIRLHEKGSKYHEMPLHHKAEAYLDAYIEVAGIAGEKKQPLFRALDRRRQLSAIRLTRRDCLAMVKRRTKQAGLPDTICNHSFRGTGIMVFLENGGNLEDAQRMANHASAKTTKLYDRRRDDVTVEMVELVKI
jgi:integrase/recombinase XerD